MDEIERRSYSEMMEETPLPGYTHYHRLLCFAITWQHEKIEPGYEFDSFVAFDLHLPKQKRLTLRFEFCGD